MIVNNNGRTYLLHQVVEVEPPPPKLPPTRCQLFWMALISTAAIAWGVLLLLTLKMIPQSCCLPSECQLSAANKTFPTVNNLTCSFPPELISAMNCTYAMSFVTGSDVVPVGSGSPSDVCLHTDTSSIVYYAFGPLLMTIGIVNLCWMLQVIVLQCHPCTECSIFLNRVANVGLIVATIWIRVDTTTGRLFKSHSSNEVAWGSSFMVNSGVAVLEFRHPYGNWPVACLDVAVGLSVLNLIPAGFMGKLWRADVHACDA